MHTTSICLSHFNGRTHELLVMYMYVYSVHTWCTGGGQSCLIITGVEGYQDNLRVQRVRNAENTKDVEGVSALLSA